MFPAGWPGIALLLLRASVAIALLLESGAHHQTLSFLMTGASLMAGVALCAGFFTPIAVAIALALHVWIWWIFGASTTAGATVISLDALALSLLGPGAYSLDSRRFGRHVVVLPPR